MSNDHHRRIATELSVAPHQVQAAVRLLDGGATVPFIARYRKEQTGSLDEVAVTTIRNRAAELRAFDERRDTILASLSERDLLSDELQAAIDATTTRTELEDLYLPYRPKRRTRATAARERGLEPLADLLMDQDPQTDPRRAALPFIDLEQEINDAEAALAGARDIVAERTSESSEARAEIRRLFEKAAVLRTRMVAGQETAGSTYRDVFALEEKAAKLPGHRIHAVLRAEREGVIRLSIRPEDDAAIARLTRRFVRGEGSSSQQVAAAVADGYRRLMAPSLENELRTALKMRADRDAIRVFADNLRELLMAPPLGPKRVLAIDPGYRTGGKLVCLDAQGSLRTHTVVRAAGSQRERAEAGRTITKLVREHRVEAIAIGNGTASRETETLVRALEVAGTVPVVLVNEAGASIYSASDIARKELPDHDITVRGAVSIGRRLIDPLAELVKIDPKSIGVGQYQHDVDPTLLRSALDDVVEQCVHAVGVDVNTTSVPLLARVSGIGPRLAENVVAYREEHGPFCRSEELKDVPRLGAKAYELAAGFLRIHDGTEPLDASAVHPERYGIVRRMAADLGCTVAELTRDAELRHQIVLERYTDEEVGMPTLNDIVAELAKPGRDPRASFEPFSFAEEVQALDDLAVGMLLPGIVTNVVDFGAFVDIGVHQDGLVHVSQLADRYVDHPSTVVRVGQRVKVTVLDVDAERGRIGLSMRDAPTKRQPRR